MSNSTPYQTQFAKKEEWRKRYWAVNLAPTTDEALRIAKGIIFKQLLIEKTALAALEAPVAPKAKRQTAKV